MSESIVRSLIEGAVTADLGKLLQTVVDLAYSAQHCKEKSKTLALKVSQIGKSVAELVKNKKNFDKENVEKLEEVFNDAIYLLRKYRNQGIFIKIFKAPFSEDGFDSIHRRLDIIVDYFGFNLQASSILMLTDLAEESRKLQSTIQSLIPTKLDEMRRLQQGELKYEEKEEVNKMVEGIVLEEFHDEHVRFASLNKQKQEQGQQSPSDSSIKVLLIHFAELGEKELAILKRLSESHTNILQFFGTYMNGNTKYAVMERPGPVISTLDEFIKSNQEPHWSLKKNLALEIAMGLQYAHAMGVIHKNLRSPHIFIDTSQELEVHPKIFAFNQGRIEALKSDKRPQSKEQVRWKAPEMLPQPKSSKHRPEYSFQCDVYSLGVILWEIITWSFPFEQIEGVRNVLQARAKMGMGLVFPPGNRSPSLQLFIKISEDCMETDPTKRPIIDEVVERLSQLVPENMPCS